MQRVDARARVQVKDQPVLIVAHRLEREQLRIDLALQVEDDPCHAGPVLADAHALDVGIVGLDLRDQLAKRQVDVQPFEIDDHPRRIR